ncbi:MAG: flagellar hook-associated protein FlgK [Alphaproteobacteria bacterium]|nr:flagellar hook-associated protein FlgK [Alphaproteobacteria bacterium]
MSLTLALNNALSGMNVAQRSLGVLSNNVANANTVGYSRQTAELSPQVTGSQGAGVRIDQIVRKIDEYLTRAVQDQTSNVGSTQVISDYMSRIQVMMGEPGGSNSLDEYVENFFNVLQSLAESPELSSFRAQAVNAGVILAREVSNLAQGLEDLRFQADVDLKSGLNTVNNEIMRLSEINQSIYRAQSMGDSTANFLDQRDLSLKKIAEFVDIKVNELDNGEVYVYTSKGSALLEYQPYQFQYNGVSSLTTFTSDSPLGSITLDAVRDDGTFIGRPETVVTSGVNHDITTTLVSGKLTGLLDLRDNTIPNMLDQLDEIAAKLRDEMNAIHNTGSGIPAAGIMTAERPLGYDDATEWTGSARIAILNEDGTSPASRYSNTDFGFMALDLDFDAMRSQYGDLLTTQNIMDEINQHFAPQNKAVVNNMDNLGLAAISNTIPDTGNTFTFDVEMQNISATNSNLWVTNLEVLDSLGASIDNQNLAPANTITLNAANTFATSAGSNVITVAATGHGYSNGDVIFLNNVAGPVDGIPAAEFNGRAFKVTNVTANSFDIEVTTNAALGLSTSMAGVTSLVNDATQIPGVKSRTGGAGYTVDLSGAPASVFYTVRASVIVEDDRGNLVTTTVDYRVDNLENNVVNQRYAARAVGAGATLEVPISPRPMVVAQLVDEDGNIASANEKGYLQLVAQKVPGEPEKKYTIAIDDLDSKQIGRPNESPIVQGSNQGFSHYFGMNNFFSSNVLSVDGDTVAGSALALKVRDDIIDNPNLVSMGTLSRTPSTVADGQPVDFSYERTTGENSVAQRLAKLGINQLQFDAAGGLPSTNKSFNGYAAEILGFTAATASSATANASDEQTLLSGFEERVNSVSGVNIDEEMANTIIFQNAYSASAQVIRTVKELFDTLIGAF